MVTACGAVMQRDWSLWQFEANLCQQPTHWAAGNLSFSVGYCQGSLALGKILILAFCILFWYMYWMPSRQQKSMAKWSSSEKVYTETLSSHFKCSQVLLAYAGERGRRKPFLDTRQCMMCISSDTLIFSYIFLPFFFFFDSDTYKIKGLLFLAQNHSYFQKHPELPPTLQLLLLGESVPGSCSLFLGNLRESHSA